MLKKYFNSILRNLLILSTSLQLSCGSSNVSKEKKYDGYDGYDIYNNITSLEAKIEGNDLKVILNVEELKYGYTGTYSWNSSKYRRELEEKWETLVSTDPTPDTEAYVSIYTYISYPNVGVIPIAFVSKNNLQTDEFGKIEFYIKNPDLVYYKFTRLIPYSDRIQYKNESNGGEFLGRIAIALKYRPWFDKQPHVPTMSSIATYYPKERERLYKKYEEEKRYYDNFDILKSTFQENYKLFNLYGAPTELLKSIGEEREKVAEERKREADEKIKERERIEKEKIAETNRLKNLIYSTITQNLETLVIYVVDEDNGLHVSGSSIYITSDALSPGELLVQRGFPPSRLNEFTFPDYPNSWKGKNFGNGQNCLIYDEPCKFQVYKYAKHKILVKHQSYYQVEGEIIPSEEGLEYIVEMSKIGAKFKLDFNIFGGKGRIKKKP